MAEKTRYLIEITYSESKDVEEIVLETDDLAWSMNQYQRNRQPLTWEMKEENLPLSLSHKMGKPYPTEEECCGEGCCNDRPEVDHATLEDLEMIHQAIVNNESDNS